MADGLIAASARRNAVDYDTAWRLETVAFDEDGNPESFERTVTPTSGSPTSSAAT